MTDTDPGGEVPETPEDLNESEAQEQSSESEVHVVGVNNSNNSNNSNIKKIVKYNSWHKGFMLTSLICGLYAANNLWEMHEFDKYVIQNVGVAANVLSAGKSSDSVMRERILIVLSWIILLLFGRHLLLMLIC